MSQGEFNKDNPWAWSDKTIVSLMDEINKIKKLVEDNPNDMTLGAKVRAWARGSKPEEVDATP